MGWFWSDAQPQRPSISAPHPVREGTEPPPSCPMHRSDSAAKLSAPRKTATPSSDPACPYQPPAASPSSAASSSPEQSQTPSYISKLNPLNYMPTSISNAREAAQQAISLPLQREPSTIPRGDGGGNWEYPSPQQMYNAMLRKGYTDTPAEHVESMVAVHNFLNEGAWEEVKGWEARFAGGLGAGWAKCRMGEAGAAAQAAFEARRRSIRDGVDPSEPKLLRFMGRPNEPTPKARMLAFMARIYPSQFPDNPPFDRHDWYVERQLPHGGKSEVRYVIDYYSGPPEPTGEPVFYLDVRPAVDGPTAACERMMRWGGDLWYRASGGSVREELARAQKMRS